MTRNGGADVLASEQTKVEVRLSADQKRDWRESAARAGLDLSAYIRRCVREAQQLESLAADLPPARPVQLTVDDEPLLRP